jgi:hypothetical protein
VSLALLLVAGCGAPAPAPRPSPAPLAEPPPPPMTPEELAEARRKAGFKDDDFAAETAQTRELGARAHVKAHLPAYRALVRGLRRSVDDIDRSARRWARAGDPQRAYRRWREARARSVAALGEQHDELRRGGVDAGATQAQVERSFRQWEDLLNDLGGDVAGQDRFAALLGELRAELDAAEAALDDIERDEDL